MDTNEQDKETLCFVVLNVSYKAGDIKIRNVNTASNGHVS